MSDKAMQVLDSIEARLAKASRGPWRRHRHVDAALPMVGRGRGKNLQIITDGVAIEADADLIAHAPADIALLARLARDAAESECAIVVLVNVGLIDRAGIESQEFHDKICRRCPARRGLAEAGAR